MSGAKDSRRGRPPKVTAADWEIAALEALAEGGLSAIAIEPIAARLATTKGSFYWYFPNREALIKAALLRWEQRTEEVAAMLERIPDPAERVRQLVRSTLPDAPGAAVALLLLADTDNPLVADVVHRVTRRRLEVVTASFIALGHHPDLARRQALASYAAYLGAAALRRGTADLAPALDAAYAETWLAILGVPPLPAADSR